MALDLPIRCDVDARLQHACELQQGDLGIGLHCPVNHLQALANKRFGRVCQGLAWMISHRVAP